ncbi:phenylalanine--tRNA ligase subunit alpha [bacterium]|nr:phenylalanine--tRNA ligase subunit alpha [bacterium]
MEIKDNLKEMRKTVLEAVKNVRSPEKLRELEIKFMGRKGELTKILRSIAALRAEKKKEIGQLSNSIKKELVEIFAKTGEELGSSLASEFVDLTLPGRKMLRGHLHPLTIVQNELEDLFISMGFMILDGPELESEYYNFEALNIPADHPARDMQDTFYVSEPQPKEKEGEEEGKSGMVMRTHTSSVQIRGMLKYGAPFRGVIPGRAFRCEATDACHEHSFFQIECLVIDKGISIANLKSVIKEMLSGIFKEEVKIRTRPGFFPFVEPGLEVDMSCAICGGQGCPSCKNSGWLEMGGAGMVHPKVLRAGGIDPKEFSGFAFGFGWDRLTMMKFKINDTRLFQKGDLRFLNQF